MKRVTILIFCIIFSLLLISCTTENDYEEKISKVIRIKLEAIEERNEEKYLTTIDEKNREYYNEQKRWIKDLLDNNIEDFNLEIIDINEIEDDTIVVKLKQTYKYKYKSSGLIYSVKYIKTDEGWKDSDLNFKIKETEHFIFNYMEGIKNLDKVIDAAEKAYDRITYSLERQPREKTVVKIYDDRELLRQTTKLSIEWQFTGWYELKEGLKIFSGREKNYDYQGLIEHELTHKITLSASNNNMPYWFCEGMAVCFANFHQRGGDPIELSWYSKEDFHLSIDKLEKMNLEKLTKDYDIGRYYGVSGMIVKYISLSYGKDKVLEIIDELGKYSYNESLINKDWDKDNQEKLEKAVKKVLDKTMEELSKEWLEWLSKR